MKEISLLILLLFSLGCVAQPLDKSFGNNGIIIMPFETYLKGSSDRITSLALQNDGKIISVDGYFRIVRYKSNGIVDSSFGTNGRIKTIFNNYGLQSARAISIQSDGKIIVSGDALRIDTTNTSIDFVIARYNADGNIDSTFNDVGKQTINLQDGQPVNDRCYAIALQADGKILLCGSTGDALAITRLNGNGTLDSSFNATGILHVELGGYGGNLKGLFVHPDGKILAGGVTAYGGNDDRFVLLQLKPNGEMDSSFGIHGIAMSFPPGGGFVHDMAMQSDGKIILAGRNLFNGGIMVRFTPAGTIDNTFGVAGYAEIISANGIVGTEQVEITPDGRIYVSGHIELSATNEDVYFVKCKNDGTIDSSYSQSGIVTSIGKYKERIHSMVVQQDGKITLAGEYRDSTSTDQYLLMRFDQFPENITPLYSRKEQIEIYPNPILGSFTIKVSSEGILKIFNQFGQMIESFTIVKGKNELKFPEVSSGIYNCIFVSNSHEIYRATISHIK